VALKTPPPSFSYRNSATRRAEAELIDLFHRCQNDKALFAKAFFDLDVSPFQLEVLNSSGRVDATVAGRRTGKTTAKVIDCMWDLACNGLERVGFVAAPSLDQAEQYVREIQFAAERSANMRMLLAGGPDKAIHRRSGFPTVELVTGGMMHCRSVVQGGRYLRGHGANWVMLAEAAFINDEVYDRAVRPLVLTTGGRIHLDSSPNGDNYVKRIFDRATASRGRYTKVSPDRYYSAAHGTVYDNPNIPRADIEAIRSEVPDWVFRTEYLAEFIDAGDTVFSWPLLVKLFDHDYPMLDRGDITRQYSIGVDLAQVHDYTAICVVDITPPAPFRLAHWRRFRGVPYMGEGGVADQVTELQKAFNHCRVHVDATSERAVAESLPNAEAVIFTGATRTSMLSHLIVMAENQALALPASFTVLRDEMRAMRRFRLAGGGIRADHPRDGFDDTLWSLALALRGVVSRGLQPAPPQIQEAMRQIRWYPSDN
jgi:phage FluMu gp28-like protein